MINKIIKIKKTNKRFFLQLYEYLITDPIMISGVVFLVSFIIITGMTIYYGYYSDRFRENLLVEAHGTLLDILLLGVFVVWLQQKGNKKVDNKRYQDEIDDFRTWIDEEAARKIRGNIRRLNNNGITEIDLNNCYLKSMDLSNCSLEGSDFWGSDLNFADLSGANLTLCQFEDVNLSETNLKGARLVSVNMWKANLVNSDLRNAFFENAVLKEADLSGSDCDSTVFKGAILSGSNLSEVNLSRADCSDVDFENAILDGTHFFGTDLRGAKGLCVEQLSACHTLWKAKIDDNVTKEIKAKYPELLEEPVAESDW
jgi:uncharacterized protein YjbI with pentapeptide repeats